MGRGVDNDFPLSRKEERKEPRLDTSVMPAIVPKPEDFRSGYRDERHYPPRVPAGRNINIFPVIASTIIEVPEEEEIRETMRRVIHEDIKEFTGTDELHYYFKSNHEGMTIAYPDGSKETFTIADGALSSLTKDSSGEETSYTYFEFPKDFYLDPYEGQDPLMTEKKRIEKEIEEKVAEEMNSPEYAKEMEEMFDFVDSKEEWDKKEKAGTLNPDGKMTVIRVNDEEGRKVLEDQERIAQGLPPIHATPPKPGEKPPWQR